MKRYLLLVLLSILKAGPISPEDGTILNYTHVLFEWEQIPEADYYELEIAENTDFSNIIFIS